MSGTFHTIFAKALGLGRSHTAALVLGTSLLCAVGGQTLGQAQPGAQPPAQPGGQPGQPGQPGGTPEDRAARAEQFRQRSSAAMKDLMKSSDEEWKVLQPQIEKIQKLQRDNSTQRMAFGMLMGGANANWRTRGTNTGQAPDTRTERPGATAADQATTVVAAKAKELQASLEEKDVPAETIKARLAELRAAKIAAKAEVTKAQEELRQLVTVRQESILVMLGVLD